MLPENYSYLQKSYETSKVFVLLRNVKTFEYVHFEYHETEIKICHSNLYTQKQKCPIKDPTA